MGRISLLHPGPEQPPNSWVHFKEIVAALIVEALLVLRQRDDLIDDEKELNRLLYFCFVEANRNLKLGYLPSPEAKNPPHLSDKSKVESENKMPDLSWNLMNHVANHEDWHRNFALECKRLGKKTDAGWVFNEEYVTHGILRFLQGEMGYGKGSEVGAMAGYIQNMGFDQILQEVNACISNSESPIPILSVPINGWQHQDVNYLSHIISRSFIPPCFLLQHFWVDMQDCHFFPHRAKIKETLVEQKNQMPNEDSITKYKKKNPKKRASRGKKRKTSFRESPQLELPIEGIVDDNENNDDGLKNDI